MMLIHKVTSSQPGDESFVQFAVRMVLDILQAGLWDRESSLSNEACQSVVLPGCPFGVYHEADAFFKRHFKEGVVAKLIVKGGSHNAQFHLAKL
jgi:hypothetical protein